MEKTKQNKQQKRNKDPWYCLRSFSYCRHDFIEGSGHMFLSPLMLLSLFLVNLPPTAALLSSTHSCLWLWSLWSPAAFVVDSAALAEVADGLIDPALGIDVFLVSQRWVNWLSKRLNYESFKKSSQTHY